MDAFNQIYDNHKEDNSMPRIKEEQRAKSLNSKNTTDWSFIGIALLSLSSIILSACATKGPKKVYSFPQAQPIPSPMNWAVDAAPRTQPGKIMDPDAVTYAQVPSRILYLPGKEGIFGRTSATQEVAYNLVPVDRIGEIIRGSSPRFDNKPEALRSSRPKADEEPETRLDSRETFTTVIAQEDGSVTRGEARRLGITDSSDREKRRATSMLRGQEKLVWKKGVGWIGFIQEKVTMIPAPGPTGDQSPKPSIPPMEDTTELPPLPDLTAPKETPSVGTPSQNPNGQNSSPKPNPSTPSKEGTTMDLP